MRCLCWLNKDHVWGIIKPFPLLISQARRTRGSDGVRKEIPIPVSHLASRQGNGSQSNNGGASTGLVEYNTQAVIPLTPTILPSFCVDESPARSQALYRLCGVTAYKVIVMKCDEVLNHQGYFCPWAIHHRAASQTKMKQLHFNILWEIGQIQRTWDLGHVAC